MVRLPRSIYPASSGAGTGYCYCSTGDEIMRVDSVRYCEGRLVVLLLSHDIVVGHPFELLVMANPATRRKFSVFADSPPSK
jgi:hypothetical protein